MNNNFIYSIFEILVIVIKNHLWILEHPLPIKSLWTLSLLDGKNLHDELSLLYPTLFGGVGPATGVWERVKREGERRARECSGGVFMRKACECYPLIIFPGKNKLAKISPVIIGFLPLWVRTYPVVIRELKYVFAIRIKMFDMFFFFLRGLMTAGGDGLFEVVRQLIWGAGTGNIFQFAYDLGQLVPAVWRYCMIILLPDVLRNRRNADFLWIFFVWWLWR